MGLVDTIIMMNCEDYKERFKAEYAQVLIRYKSLRAMVSDWNDGKLSFEPTCPKQLLISQLYSMANYKAILEERAIYESIDLTEIKKCFMEKNR